MLIRQSLMAVSLTLLMCAGIGCGASREIEVKGQVASSGAAQVEGPITIQFFDILEAQKPSLVHSITLSGLTSFDAKASLEGKEFLVRAINDRDNNAACSAGEAWAEARVSIKDDDTVDAVSLELTAASCPAE